MSVAEAYDAIAPQYDQQLQGDEWMRAVLWRCYRRAFRPGQHVLDVACGTGIDTLFLAGQGIRVTAVDISPGMIAQLQEKLAQSTLPAPVTTQVLNLADLHSWPAGPFDGLISAFAGLNTLSDLGQFAAHAASRLRPGGRLIIHMLNRRSLWQWLSLVAQGQWGQAQRLNQQTGQRVTIGGQIVTHHLYDPLELFEGYFSPYFRWRRLTGLGILRPPLALRWVPWPMMAMLGWLERPLAGQRPFCQWGRFFILELEKSKSSV